MKTSPTRLATFSVRIAGFLGLGYKKISIISSALLASISFFYIFSLASYIQVTVYIFIRRVSYINPFDDYLITRYFDGIIISSLTVGWIILSLRGKLRILVSSIYGTLLVIAIAANIQVLIDLTALVALPMIVIILSCHKLARLKQKRIVQHFSLGLASNYLVIIAVVLGVITIMLTLSVIFLSKSVPIHNYGYDLFLFFSSFSPLILILIFLCYPVKSLTSSILKRVKKLDNRWWSGSLEPSSEESRKGSSKKLNFIYLSLIVLFSISLALIPQLPTVNKDNQQIGSDSETYVEWITALQGANDLQDFFKTAFIDLVRGDRPLTLVILFLLTTFIDAPPLDVYEYLPVVLAPSLALVVYFLTRELTANETTSMFAAFLTGIGYFQISIGIYAGFYANWIALIVGYLSLIFFFRYLRTSDNKSLLAVSILNVTMLFTHAYTWNVLILVMGIFLGVSLVFRLYPRKRATLLLLVVLSSVIIDLIKTRIVESTGSAGGVKLVIELAQSYVGLKDPGLVWDTLVDATQHHFGGIFCAFIILVLVSYWIIRSNFRLNYNIFLGIFLMIAIPPLFFGDWVVQSRVYYNIPFQVPAAIALTYISRQRNATKILVPICVWLVAISIRTVSNFYEVLPS